MSDSPEEDSAEEHGGKMTLPPWMCPACKNSTSANPAVKATSAGMGIVGSKDTVKVPKEPRSWRRHSASQRWGSRLCWASSCSSTPEQRLRGEWLFAGSTPRLATTVTSRGCEVAVAAATASHDRSDRREEHHDEPEVPAPPVVKMPGKPKKVTRRSNAEMDAITTDVDVAERTPAVPEVTAKANERPPPAPSGADHGKPRASDFDRPPPSSGKNVATLPAVTIGREQRASSVNTGSGHFEVAVLGLDQSG
ncbi:hypothetical protein MTO96_022077 [Rhipicephalus appendiculatus]